MNLKQVCYFFKDGQYFTNVHTYNYAVFTKILIFQQIIPNEYVFIQMILFM